MEDIGGVWRTVGGRRIFIKDGEDLSTAMKNSGKFKTTFKTSYDYEKDGKMTRNSLLKYLEGIRKEINDETQPDYDNMLLNMRGYGYGIKNIRKLEFNDTSSEYSIMATFDNGLDIQIWYKNKY